MFLIKTVVECKNKDDNIHKSKAEQIIQMNKYEQVLDNKKLYRN